MTVAHPSRGSARPLASLRQRLTGESARDVATTAGTNLGATLLTSVGGIFLARNLGATDRGGLVTVLLWPTAIGSLASLGITQATCYWVSRRRAQGAAIVATATRAAVLTGLAVAVVGLAVAPLIGRTESVTGLLRLVLVLSPVFIAAGVWMSALQAVDIAAWNRARMVQPVVYSLGVLGLALAQRLTLSSATAAYGCSILLQAWNARTQAGRSVVGTEPRPPHLLSTLYRYGVRVWASTVPRLVNVRLDQLALSVLPAVALSDVGVYAVAASLSWLALPAATAFGSVAFPAVAKATSEPAIRRIERVSLLGSAGAAAVTLSVASAAAPFVVPRLFGSDFEGAVVCLWLLAPGTVFLAMNSVLADLLQGRGRPLSTSAGEATGAVLTVVLLVTLTPRYGIKGAAVASSVAYAGATTVLYSRLRVARLHSTSSTEGPNGA